MSQQSFLQTTATGSDINFTITTFSSDEILVYVDGVKKTAGVDYNINPYNSNGQSTVDWIGTAPTSPSIVRVVRQTDVLNNGNTAVEGKATFVAGSSVKAEDLNNNTKQVLRSLQEHNDQLIQSYDLEPGVVITSTIADGAVTTVKLANDAVTQDKLANDSVGTPELIDGSVTSGKILDGTIVNADVNAAAAIDGTKVNPSFGSQNILTSGTLGAGATTIGALGVTGNITVSGTVDGRDVATDGTKLDTIETNAKDDQSAAEIKVLLQANKLTAAEIEAAALDGRYYTETELDNGQLDNRYFTETELTNGALDGRYYTETESEARFLRQDSTETIASGSPWSNSDAFVATTAAINARIIDLIDDVGGFDIVPNQTSFPNSNPQGSTGQAAVLSIAATTATLTPSGTTVTIANGNLAGNATITINNVPAVIPQGFGFLVESTSTLHTYTFHRQVPKASDVSAVASNITNVVAAGANVVDINNFADLYQIASSAPTQRADGSSLSVGDLWFDNSNNNLTVWNGSAFATITPSQSVLNDVAIVSGAITFQEDLGLIINPVSTGSSNGSLDIVADALEDEITIAVTVANYSGVNKFVLDGDTANPAKTLSLHKGWTYTFDQSDASNNTHRLAFKTDSGSYTTNVVTSTAQPGNAGAFTKITIPESQPTGFRYYCVTHGNAMGNTITVVEDPIKGVADVASNVVTVAGSITNVNTVAGSITNVNNVGSSINDVNRYAAEYIISANAPSSPNPGDLWYDATNNVLKSYNGSAFLGITSNSGIQNVADDTSPQLGAALDCQNNGLTNVGNISGVGTIDGTNLQLDFGTI